MKKNLISFLCFCFFASVIYANDWKSINLEATDGTNIEVSYQTKEKENQGSDFRTYQKFWLASPLYIKVFGPKLAKAKEVEVVLLNFKHTQYDRNVFIDTYHFNLVFSEKDRQYYLEFQNSKLEIYDGELVEHLKYDGMEIKAKGSFGDWNYRQELAVVIKDKDGNEKWLNDPISQSHNFKFNIFDNAF
jgi:hypothetical protein